MSGKYALIIGNTEYSDPGLAQLSAPGRDAEDFARVLKDKEIGAFDDVNVLLNQSSSAVNEAIDEFFDQKKPDDLLILYFSGHGVRDELGSLYLAVKNTFHTRLRSTAIKSDYIREVMDQSRSKRQVLILDCCNSGAFAQGTKAFTGGSIGTASAFEGGYGRIILTASDSTQFAWEGDKVIGETDNSLFTHYLVEGLKGEADLDGDGRITVDELYDYAYEKVRLATPKQTPSKFSSKQQGEIILRQSTRIENIKPLPLSADLIDEIEDTRPYVREAAVQKLDKILRGKNIGLARSAREALEKIIADENTTRRVAQVATQVLVSLREEEQKADEERRAKEEAERLAMLKVEEERLANEKAEAERKAREEVEKLAHAKAEQETAEREAARLKAEREEAELSARMVTEKAVKEKAEKESAKREADRLKAEQEATREKAEREASEKAMVIPGKIASPQTTPRRQPILTWAIIGIIGLCVIASGVGIISYLASLGGVATAAPTEAPLATEPLVATEAHVITETTASPFVGKLLVAPDCNYDGTIESIMAADRYTVIFNLCRPDPAFLSKVAFNVFAIYPEEWLQSTTGNETRTMDGFEKPVGTGPYMIGEWQRGESIIFTANPNYWGTTPATGTLVFRWSSESAARLLELQAGNVDGIDNIGPEDFNTVRNNSDLVLAERPQLNVMYIGMTNTFAPFDNQKVRQALAMGVDRQRIVDNFYPAGSEIADYFTPCAIPNGCVGDKWYDFDPVTAKALLAEAGFPDGFQTKLYYRDVVRSYLPQASNVAQDIQAQLKENLNVYAEIVVMESGAYIQEFSAGGLDGLYLHGWGADYPHITNFLDYYFGSANPQFGNQSPTYTNLLAQGTQIADPKAAEPIYVQANNAIRDFVPMIPVAHGGSGTAYRADVTTPQASPLGDELFYASKPGTRDTFVWMQNAEPISMFCADESDGESLRACEQVTEALYSFTINGADVEPALAESCIPNVDLTVWTCALRKGVKFHDGTDFDANDVVTTFTMGLDASSPLHKGNTNTWSYYDYLFGLINKP
jgi:ABC-type transport system substrate-binding protein/uncharacterized caspase-like protein